MLKFSLMKKLYSSNNFLMMKMKLTVNCQELKILSIPMSATLSNSQTTCSEGTVKGIKTITSKDTVSSISKTVTSQYTIKFPTKTVKRKDVVKGNMTTTVDTVKKNRNDKIGIDKNNDYAYVKKAPKKLCNNCVSSSNLSYVYNKQPYVMKNITNENGNLHRTLAKKTKCL